MRMNVVAEMLGDDGTPIWGYMCQEVIVLPAGGDPQEQAERAAARILDTVDAAKASIGEQIKMEMQEPPR